MNHRLFSLSPVNSWGGFPPSLSLCRGAAAAAPAGATCGPPTGGPPPPPGGPPPPPPGRTGTGEWV